MVVPYKIKVGGIYVDKFLIKGGKRLEGAISISGSKNSALPILFATLLTDEKIILKNIPNLRDIDTTLKLLRFLGKKIDRKQDEIIIEQTDSIKTEAEYDLVRQMRASALVMGPLVARYGHVKVSLPGGCAIGARPLNIHLDGLKKLGADINLEEGYVNLKASGLKGAKIVLDYPSVGATENIIMAAVLAKGVTIIENIAREPEIEDLCDFLNSMGADIKGMGSNCLTINGVKKLNSLEYKVIPDRIEAGTFMIASAVTGGNVLLKNVFFDHLNFVIDKMKETGVEFVKEKEGLRILSSKVIKPISIETLPYPGFSTDMQAQWMLFMTQAEGGSMITETVFENRFMHVSELQRMGAALDIKGNSVFVKGNSRLSAAPVMATDLRASAALVLAGLIAEGETEISRIYHIDRGYEHIEVKLNELGADVKRVM
jgi:UDP-N-acetylglucosamine 1-carboxyvinyltransferase